jgi:hypothetical protein
MKSTNSERQRRHRKTGARLISTPISDEAAKALAAIQERDKSTVRAAIEAALISQSRAPV